MRKLKILAITIAVCLGSLVGAATFSSEMALAGSCPAGSLRGTSGSYTNSLAECNIPDNAPGTEKDLMQRIIDIINVVVGVVSVVAVIVIVIGGIIFVTSTGDTAKVTRARNTVVYGVLGLVIAMLAFALVSFVSNNAFKGGSGGGGSGSGGSNGSQSEGSSEGSSENSGSGSNNSGSRQQPSGLRNPVEDQ